MARLGFGGFEFAHVHAEGLTSSGSGGVLSYDATPHGGSKALKLTSATPGSATGLNLLFTYGNPAAGVAVTLYGRFAFKYDVAPSAPIVIAAWTNGSTITAGATLNTDGSISFPGGTSAPLTANVWYVIEMSCEIGATNGSGAGQGIWTQARINGATVGTHVNVANNRPSNVQFRLGVATPVTLSNTVAFAYDDWAVNDDSGAANSSWVGAEELCGLLLPVGDATIGANWKLGTGTTPSGNLYDSLNNVPSTGKAQASAANGDQARNNVVPTGVAADEASVNLQSYTAAGLGGAKVVAAFLVSELSSNASSINVQTIGVASTSNPTIGEVTASISGPAGAYPTSWTRVATALSVSPTVVHATSPVAKVRFATSPGSASALVSALGLLVAYLPPQTVSPTGIVSEAAVGAPLVGGAGGPQSVLAVGVAPAEVVPAPAVVAGPVAVGPAGGIASRQAFGTARAGRVVVPTAIGSGEAVGSPALPTVAAAGIASAAAFGALVVAGPVTAAAIASAGTFGTPEILGQVRPPGLPSREAVGTPRITGGYHRYDFVPASAPQTTTNGVTRDFPITLSGLGSVKDVEVSLYLTNPGGLAGNAVTLIAPNGQSVALIPNNANANRTATGAGTADQQRTHFDSEAAVAWGSLSTAPWVGRFRPSGNLAALNGTDPNGVWRLRVADRKQGNTVNTIRVATLLLDVVAPLVPQTLSPPAIASAGAIGAATVGGPLLPPAIASREAVGQPVVQSVVQFAVVFGLAIASRQAIGTPVVSGPVTPTSVASTQAVGTPTVDLGAAAQLTIINAGAIASAGGVGGAALTQTATVIRPVAIPSGETFGQAAPVIPPWVVVPPAPAGSGAPGSGPVVGPAPTGRRASWLRDPFTNYNWPLNHSAESAVTVTRPSSRGAPRLDVGFARQQDPAEPLVLRLEGVLLDPAQLAALENFYDRCGLWPVVFHDADGDEYEVIITAFDAHRVRGYNPHTHGSSYWRYSMQLDVLRALAGAYQVIA